MNRDMCLKLNFKLFYFQYRCLRGRQCDATGPLAVASGDGPRQMVRRVHQLVPPHEVEAHHHRTLPRHQREYRALSPDTVRFYRK